ncbi:MAG: OsmC family protein [Chitinophagales bacterium]|nr:OsmC family protein [Chitinophagales bacterium]
MIKNVAHAEWNGSVKEGNGKITLKSEVLKDQNYSFKTRFGGGQGTNPDELIAAAHAGCFAMALSLILGEAGFTPESIKASAEVTMNPDKLELTGSHITVSAKVPNITKEKFLECANAAKDNCPVSKALSFAITMDATLE